MLLRTLMYLEDCVIMTNISCFIDFMSFSVSSLSRSGTPVNTLPKLPPIITSEIDRSFLLDLNDYIKYETEKLTIGDDDQKYTIYKSVFNKVGVNDNFFNCSCD